MKFLVGCSLLLLSFFAFSNGHDIKIELRDLEEDSVLLGYHYGTKRLRLDTIAVTNDLVKIAGDDPLPSGIYFLYTLNFYFEFIVKEQEFSLSFSAKDPHGTLVINGSEENRLLFHFQKQMGQYQKSIRELRDSLKQASSGDSITIAKQIQELNEASMAFKDETISMNPDAWFSKVVQMQFGVPLPTFDGLEGQELQIARLKFLRSNYFKGFGPPGVYMRTPTFYRYVKNYFTQVAHQAPDSLNFHLDAFLEKCEEDEDTFRFWVTEFLGHYQKSKIMGQDRVYIHLIEKYCLTGKTPWISDETIKDLREEVIFIKPGLIGNIAPSFQAVDTLLKPIDFKDFKRDFYVLMFYDPDCGHCQKLIPLLDELHAEIKAMGGEVFGICTTTIVDEWKAFVRSNELDWVHMADPSGKSRFRVDYNVRTTPQLYVLDSSFEIVAKKLDIESQLMSFLNERFGMNP